MTNYQIESREWWVQRWLELLDSYRFKKRLERARIYAREGNVLSIDFEEAQVLAKVQGSEPEPYQVSFSLNPFTDEDWNYIIETLSQKAIFSAQLLAGEMPKNIESVFIANGLSLFPFTLSDIHSRCTCPDKANPCKHIGAVYYQLADRFSEDPFVLFQLRGRTKGQILKYLRQFRGREVGRGGFGNPPVQKSEGAGFQTRPYESQAVESTTISDSQSSLNIEQFWKYDEPLDSSLVVIVPPSDNKTVLDLLGTMPLAYNEAQAVKKYLEQVYQTVSQETIKLALERE